MNDRKKQVLFNIGVFALPLLLVKVAGTVLGPVEASAASDEYAMTPAAGPSQDAVNATQWSPTQRSAAEYLESLRARSFGPSPLRIDGAVRTAERSTTNDSYETPELEVTGILRGQIGAQASIGGRVYRVGQTIVETQWVVTEIDHVNSSVTLLDPETDRTVVLEVQLPL